MAPFERTRSLKMLGSFYHVYPNFFPLGETPEPKSHDEDKDSVPESELTKFSQMTLKELLSSIYSPLLFFSLFFVKLTLDTD